MAELTSFKATDLYDLAIKGVVPEGEAGAPGQTNFIALQRCWEKCEEILHEPDLPDEFYIQLAYYRSAYQQNYYSHSLLDQALAKANKFEESEFYEHPMKKVIEEELKNRFSGKWIVIRLSVIGSPLLVRNGFLASFLFFPFAFSCSSSIVIKHFADDNRGKSLCGS